MKMKTNKEEKPCTKSVWTPIAALSRDILLNVYFAKPYILLSDRTDFNPTLSRDMIWSLCSEPLASFHCPIDSSPCLKLPTLPEVTHLA